MDGLKDGALFDELFIDDPDGLKLNEMPLMEESFELYKEKFSKVCDELVDFGVKEQDNREKVRQWYILEVRYVTIWYYCLFTFLYFLYNL